MTTQQYHYYRFFDWHRKTALYKHHVYNNAKQKIRDAIAVGVDPRNDPELKKYWVLINEDDKELFISEILKMNLTFEDESMPKAEDG